MAQIQPGLRCFPCEVPKVQRLSGEEARGALLLNPSPVANRLNEPNNCRNSSSATEIFRSKRGEAGGEFRVVVRDWTTWATDCLNLERTALTRVSCQGLESLESPCSGLRAAWQSHAWAGLAQAPSKHMRWSLIGFQRTDCHQSSCYIMFTGTPSDMPRL